MSKRGQSGLYWIVQMVLLLGSLVLLLVQRDRPFIFRNQIPDYPLIGWLGICILAPALLFAIWARIILGRNWSGGIQQVKQQHLIDKGPYAIVRHPIYGGLILGAFGTALVTGSIAGFFGMMLIAISYVIKIHREQRFLMDVFGEAYQRYSDKTWCIFPYIY